MCFDLPCRFVVMSDTFPMTVGAVDCWTEKSRRKDFTYPYGEWVCKKRKPYSGHRLHKLETSSGILICWADMISRVGILLYNPEIVPRGSWEK
jgi:hypothetical protein